ncbi:ABC transporter ATP-binding protein [Reyranella sp. CPCC 100927]|uniref:ABC transporter ATP-binding protein n=1 Tax=Reyranella sp. CPCC 100927 TaxID=2599616 RepID=UPI0011B3F724|nr:ABC transporter ATP-binding protein [Reyranella sp. CPCC 100927]TWT15300.1 ABC transporter ATP-binding protein [Reyranella sp. CPCC 100927]
MLEVENLSVAYGKHEALRDVALRVETGRTVVILGANGAGKTTLLNAIAGLVPARPGARIAIDGASIQQAPAHRIVERGVALVPEGRRLFGEMSVLDNLRLGAYAQRAREGEGPRLERMLALFQRLGERRHQLTRTMSGGEQQMVAIARALMSSPRLLLLDEPSLGLSPRLGKELFATLRQLASDGQSILLVEQAAHLSLRLADWVYVLENGRIVRSGTPDDIRNDNSLRRSYLGL